MGEFAFEDRQLDELFSVPAAPVVEDAEGRRREGEESATEAAAGPAITLHQRWAAKISEYHDQVQPKLPNSRTRAESVGHVDTYKRLSRLKRGEVRVSVEEARALSSLPGWSSFVFPEGSEFRVQYEAALSGPLPVSVRQGNRLVRGGQEWAGRISDYHDRIQPELPKSEKLAKSFGHEGTYQRLAKLRIGAVRVSVEEARVLSSLPGWSSFVFPEGSEFRAQYEAALSGPLPVSVRQGNRLVRGGQEWAGRISDYHDRIQPELPNSRTRAESVGHVDTYKRLSSLKRGAVRVSVEEARVLSSLPGWSSFVFPEGSEFRVQYEAALSGPSLVSVRQGKRRGGQEWAGRISDYCGRLKSELPIGRKLAKSLGHEDTYARLMSLRRGAVKVSVEEARVLSSLPGWSSHVFPEGSEARARYLEVSPQVSPDALTVAGEAAPSTNYEPWEIALVAALTSPGASPQSGGPSAQPPPVAYPRVPSTPAPVRR
ncbi:hypothetical protein ABT336_04590 [Micromonospora sp. NPDC000207]|uniref:hypothetical protein n=1 Tax=Micromonospora sp. NPDC000207 TaxID=3154246 RepID=UPI0033248207